MIDISDFLESSVIYRLVYVLVYGLFVFVKWVRWEDEMIKIFCKYGRVVLVCNYIKMVVRIVLNI